MNLKIPFKVGLALLITFLYSISFCEAQTVEKSQTEELFNRFKMAAQFDYRYPREKVYMHFDNSAYFEGDTLWYKAYVVRASSLKPTTLSKILYVELLDTDGQEIDKQILQLDNMGTAHGGLSLALPVRAGYYEVRAYTREMVNWGTEACFSRILPVFTGARPSVATQGQGHTSDIVKLSLPQPEYHGDATLSSPRPYEIKDESGRLLTFYPEGGERVRGVRQRIAYKLTDGRGLPVDDTLNIYNAKGTLCAISSPDYEGMGDFYLTEDFGDEGYATLNSSLGNKHRQKKFNLPHPINSYALTAQLMPDGLYVDVASSDSLATYNNLLGLAVFNRENATFFDTLTVGHEEVEILVPTKALRGGVNKLTLFDRKGREICNRLFWSPFSVSDSARVINVDMKQNKLIYEPFTPAVVSISLNDKKGHSVEGASLSLSARDEASNVLSCRDGGMEGQLLLASEVRGYIHRPDLYFQRNDAAHRRMIDLLLSVQGWSANTFNVMSGEESFALKQPIEDKLTLCGTIYKDNNKLAPFPNLNLTMHAYRYENSKVMGEAIEGATTTDAEGKFAFESNVNFEGEYLALFTMRSGDKKHKGWSRLGIDRWFSPTPRSLYAPDLQLNLYDGSDNALRAFSNPNERTFEWKDTIPQIMKYDLHAAEVVVSTKRYHGFTGNRYSWGGGEDYGRQKSMKFINIQRELERYKDSGAGTTISLGDLLKYLDNNINYDRNTDLSSEALGTESTSSRVTEEVSETQNKQEEEPNKLGTYFYKGHALRVYHNNVELTDIEVERLMEEESANIKSVSFVIDNKRSDALSGDEKRYSSEKYCMYIYELPDAYRKRMSKGKEYRHISGFTPNKKFYSPNYRQFDLPSSSDVRRTLLWLPTLTTDKDGKATVIFFTNSRPNQTLDITLRGITKDGKIVDYN